jgi:hypothetical protein
VRWIGSADRFAGQFLVKKTSTAGLLVDFTVKV